METALASAQAGPAPRPLAARMIGVLTSPRSTYAAVASHPRWFGVLAAVIVVGGAAGSAFVSSEVGQRAVIDAQITAMESMGRHPSEAQLDRIEQMARYYPVFATVIQAVSVTGLTLLVAAIGFAVFGALLGGNASFRQIFAMVAHSSVVLLAQGLFSLPLDYARETMVSPTSLAVFAPFLDDGTFAARLLASIDLFYIWWSINLAIGFGVLYKRRTAPVAATMLGIDAAIAVLVAAIRTAMAGA